MKAIEPVESKSSGRKLADIDAEVSLPRKRHRKTKVGLDVSDKTRHVQDKPEIPESHEDAGVVEVNAAHNRKKKIKVEVEVSDETPHIQDKPEVHTSHEVHDNQDHKVFRFLDLPGELRNRIYEYAAANTYRLFPHTHPKDNAPKHGRRLSKSTSASLSALGFPPLAPKSLPYIGLTQSCSLIRTEFRPMWLSAHRFPLFAVPGYLKIFFPLLRGASHLSEKQQARSTSYFDPRGELRVWLRKDDLSYDIDIVKLLKHKTRFPEFTITFVPSPYSAVPDDIVASLEALLNNRNHMWTAWIARNIVTQVRLTSHGVSFRGPMRIVVKDKYAPTWMRWFSGANRQYPEGYTEGLGLGGVKAWEISFGVDYS